MNNFFDEALKRVLVHEGLYDNDPDDPGGETYKGIARKIYPAWDGWVEIDMAKRQTGFPEVLNKNTALQQSVSQFYEVNYWHKVKADDMTNFDVAFSIFDFAVNAGVGTSAALAQMVVGAKPDGVIGPVTIEAINSFDAEHFMAAFTVAKVARYVSIVKKRPTSQKYFYGWIRRTIGDY